MGKTAHILSHVQSASTVEPLRDDKARSLA